MVDLDKNRKIAAESSSHKSEPLLELHKIINDYKKKHNLDSYEIIDLILNKKTVASIDLIPISIFNNDSLSALEAIVKFLKENQGLTVKKISTLLNRSSSTISTTFNNSTKKMPSAFTEISYDITVPVSIFSDRKLSTLENLVYYLKTEFNYSFHKIALLLNRNDRTIWTIQNRATRKQKLSEVSNKFETKNKCSKEDEKHE